MAQSAFGKELEVNLGYLEELCRRTILLFMDAGGRLRELGWQQWMTTPSEFYTRHSASATRVELWYPSIFVKYFVKGQDKSAVSAEASRVLGLGVQLRGTAKGFEPKIHGLLLEFSKPRTRIGNPPGWYWESACELSRLTTEELTIPTGLKSLEARFVKAKTAPGAENNWPDLSRLSFFEVPMVWVDAQEDLRNVIVEPLHILGESGLEAARDKILEYCKAKDRA
jgi:hypothetical protein